MQENRKSESNATRTANTRSALIHAARALFVEKGFHATGTPEIVAAAGMTRGALYHHFADKTALFDAVVSEEAAQVAEEIDAATTDVADAKQALIYGAAAYFDTMASMGRVRLLLIDGPIVLGLARMQQIDAVTGGATLQNGLASLLSDAVPPAETAAIADVLSAGFDRAALAVSEGGSKKFYLQAIHRLINALVG